MLLYSSPIKVVSKPDQVQKRRKKREEEAKRKAASVALATGLAPAAASVMSAPLFGHPLTEEMVKALQAVERQQHAQQELLNRLVEHLSGRPPNIVLTQSELLALESLGVEPLELGDPQEPVSGDESDSDTDDGDSSDMRKRTTDSHCTLSAHH